MIMLSFIVKILKNIFQKFNDDLIGWRFYELINNS